MNDENVKSTDDKTAVNDKQTRPLSRMLQLRKSWVYYEKVPRVECERCNRLGHRRPRSVLKRMM